MADRPVEAPPEALRRFCDSNELGFETTSDVPAVTGILGQDRAVAAINFGLEIDTHGYNLYVSGVPGTGRTTTVISQLQQLALTMPSPDDWCYVYNFNDAFRPTGLQLPSGMGKQLAKDMDDLIERCKREIPRVFESDMYKQRRQEFVSQFESMRDELYKKLEAGAEEVGFTVQFSAGGALAVPMKDGKTMTPEEFQALPQAEQEEYRKKGETVQEHLDIFLKQVRDSELTTNQEIHSLDEQGVMFAVGHLVETLISKYMGFTHVVNYLKQVDSDIVEHFDNFRPQPAAPEGQPPPPGPGGPGGPRPEEPFTRYKVNVLVSNDNTKGAPVIVEMYPTYYNVMGRVDYLPRFGTMYTDHTLIKPGALHLANGGYLILQIKDVVTTPLTWESLKRALDTHQITIENISDMVSAVPTQTLKPEPLPLQVKVIVIGTPDIYRLLYQRDEDFRKLFKAKADFDTEMDRTPENIAVYASFIKARVTMNDLLPFHKSGVAKVVELGSRLLEHQEKLSTRFVDIEDVVSEASFWAKKANSVIVTAEHVQRAIAEKELRSSLYRDKMHDIIQENVIKISTTASVVGQLNGLSVLDSGDFMFGLPSRITARTSPGIAGVVNVEREIEMSGKIHSKGVMILTGYLAGKYARHKPLSLSASLTFEQLYNEVDGDSASSTELYCLLSDIADLPLRQDIAVTGSVNQLGEVQAIGGAQYKIEGFFDVCKAKGLTGTQGVMIPASNLNHLMLREDVVEAVKAGQFHVYTATSIDQGIELLTGVSAGKLKPDGTYPKGTVNYLVAQRLEAYSEQVREFGHPVDNHHDHASAIEVPVTASDS